MLLPSKGVYVARCSLYSYLFLLIKYLTPEWKVVLIFSNLAQVVDEESTHPIIEELQKNNRFRKELHLKRDVRASSRRTKRRDDRDKEKVELWVLALKEQK